MPPLSLTAHQLMNHHVDNGQDGNVPGEEERKLLITPTSTTEDSSNPTSAIQQLLTTGTMKLQDASTTLMSGLAANLNASGQPVKNLFHQLISANLNT